MSGYTIRKSARVDIKEIASYTEKTWGTRKRYDYLARLQQRFEDIASRPHLGRNCDHIRKGYFSIREGRHIIFYQKADKHIEVARVIHESRDLKRAMQQARKNSQSKKSKQRIQLQDKGLER